MDDMGEARIFTCRICTSRNRIWPGQAAVHAHKIRCGQCGRDLFLGPDAPLTAISPAAYEHPLDRKALAVMRKVPGVQTVLKFLLKELSERRLRMLVQQAHLKVTPRQLASLYRMMEEGARTLDLPHLPELFISQEPAPNAYAVGVDQPFVVVTTALLDLLDDAQIKGVIAHELGHIHAGHQLYRTALYMIVHFAERSLGSAVPFRDAALTAVYYALMHWSRCSELTADRAQMLVQRDFDSFVSCEMKLAGGCRYTNAHLDTEAFLEQGREAVAMQEEHVLNRLFASMQAADSTHPYPVWRVGHMQQWVLEGNYLDILSGSYPALTPDDAVPPPEEEDRKSVPDTIKSLLANWRSTL